MAQVASQAALVSGSGAAVFVLIAAAHRAAQVAARVRDRDVGQVFLADMATETRL